MTTSEADILSCSKLFSYLKNRVLYDPAVDVSQYQFPVSWAHPSILYEEGEYQINRSGQLPRAFQEVLNTSNFASQ